MPKLQVWTPEIAKKELATRLAACRQARLEHERHWQQNELTIYAINGTTGSAVGNLAATANNGVTAEFMPDSNLDSISINYVMKDLRYIHSQLALNPPAVIPRPTSSDPEDRRRADAADRLIRYGLRQYNIQEQFDQTNNNCLVYGTGILKGWFDPLKGDIAEFNEETGEVIMEGDYNLTPISPWHFYIDPDATRWEDVVYVFEEIPMRYEEAAYLFPDRLSELERNRERNSSDSGYHNDQPHGSVIQPRKSDVVRVFCYHEKGTPMNGMLGRFVYHLADGSLLTPVRAHPHAFSRPPKKGQPVSQKLPKIAKLPFHIITDLDIPGTVWGRSVVSYAASLQESLNMIDNITLDILRAHGVARIIMHEDAELSDDSITCLLYTSPSPRDS